ncbi:hypothetical protein TEA_023614 [Camellia sinensis var. sinensis]|uniref:NB-ARC domain-containing protein n=1 Tax=Camellia sinensis var. sinensis TaxID=542762 RepID=A0A4S4DHR1_CAMSN|nr:hypothetical protein TEA_023614 [Camellia sinensis var. sinensis]
MAAMAALQSSHFFFSLLKFLLGPTPLVPLPGMMGSGKTTVSKVFSEALAYSFVDSNKASSFITQFRLVIPFIPNMGCTKNPTCIQNVALEYIRRKSHVSDTIEGVEEGKSGLNFGTRIDRWGSFRCSFVLEHEMAVDSAWIFDMDCYYQTLILARRIFGMGGMGHILKRLKFLLKETRNATGLVAPAITVGLGDLTHTLGTIVPVIGASGFATTAVATAIGTVVGSFR